MDKEELLNKNKFGELTATEIWEKLYNRELDCKKNILEYIDITRVLKKENASEEQITDTYNYIYKHIESLKDLIKPNTMMYLKNSLKSQFGKYVKDKDPKPVNYFLEFFKAAYPENNRRKDFTWVLMDINKISEEQIWTTLIYINRECLNNNLILNCDQEKDIIKMIKKLVAKNNMKYINDVRALKQFTDNLGISIISVGEGFKVISI
jgi:ribosomal protein S8